MTDAPQPQPQAQPQGQPQDQPQGRPEHASTSGDALDADRGPAAYELEPIAEPPRSPEVVPPRAAAAETVSPEPSVAEAPGPVPFVRPGLGDARTIAIAGATVVIAASVLAWVQAPSRGWAFALQTLFLGAVHGASGAAAAAMVSAALERTLGKIELAAARMLLAVGAFLLIANAGLSMPWIAVLLLGIAAYATVTMILFRWPPREWLLVAGVHGILWGVLMVSTHLQRLVTASVPA